MVLHFQFFHLLLKNHKTMKKIFMYFGIIILFCSCSFNKHNKHLGLTIRVKVNDNYRASVTNKIFYNVKLSIKNNTDSIIYYWIMTCSWQENWISPNKALSLKKTICLKNFPTLDNFNPKELVELDGIISLTDSLNTFKGKTFKLGFILIRKQEIINESDFHDILNSKIKNRQDIFWSEPFTLVQ